MNNKHKHLNIRKGYNNHGTKWYNFTYYEEIKMDFRNRNRIEGLLKISDLKTLRKVLISMKKDMLEEGYDKWTFVSYIDKFAKEVAYKYKLK